MKNGTFIVGHWVRDKLHGRALIFNPYGSVLSVEYVDNKLNGWVIAQFSNKVVLANTYFEDKVDGHRIIYEASDELWILTNTTRLG
jgi:antitoxin component YwqK of YwqJK toxin-antitoxin module